MPRLRLMHFLVPPHLHHHPHILFFFFFFFFSLFFSLSLSDPRITGANLHCSTKKYVTGTPYIQNFVKNMEVLSQHVTDNRWGNYYLANSSMYSLAQCMGDLSQTDCLLCFSESRTRLPRCIPNDSGRIFLDGCFLRYDTYNFFNESVDPKLDKAVCEPPTLSENYLRLEFARKTYSLIDNVTQTALGNGGFGVSSVLGGVTSVYGMAQCWKSLSASGCKKCLEKAGKELRDCVPGKQGRSLNAGCYMRYSSERFFDVAVTSETDSGGLSKEGMVALIAIGSVAFSLLAMFGVFIGYKRHQMLTKERNNLGRLSSAVSKSNLNFKYETLEKATEFFDPSRKLGQGGAGSVFKGTLPDGKVVAVKRLFFNTRQWVDEFFNEVNLISGIHHKNLVQLLGCSIEGPESLLVYEYVPNKSLDQILFDKNHPQFVNWQQRFDIITGTAEGLAFLHGGTETRIIHRDIKGSNILLEDDLTAKIADFGLARCFSADKTHLSTGIAGTLGYMAPEYLVRGQLTEKADVYSFGVLVLEIVCGRKNNVFVQESGSVLQTVWRNYKSHSLPNAVDPALNNDFPDKQASNVLQVGLLCTQASAALRPSMSDVVQMLTDDEFTIPLPKQPPFLNASLMDPDAPSGSFGMSTPATRRDTDTTRSSSMSSNSTSFKSSNTSSSHHFTTIEVSKTS